MNQHEPGAKLDEGKAKARLTYLDFPRAQLAVAAIGTFGADKYTERGWEQVPDGFERYTDAMLRHLLSEGSGELRDPESNMLHAAHAAWNALARLELMLREMEVTA